MVFKVEWIDEAIYEQHISLWPTFICKAVFSEFFVQSHSATVQLPLYATLCKNQESLWKPAIEVYWLKNFFFFFFASAMTLTAQETASEQLWLMKNAMNFY